MTWMGGRAVWPRDMTIPGISRAAARKNYNKNIIAAAVTMAMKTAVTLAATISLSHLMYFLISV